MGWDIEYKIDAVSSEKIGVWTGQGMVSGANFVGSMKLVEGICVGLGLQVHYVTPPTWKRAMGLIKKDKDYSRAVALRLWPDRAGWLKLKGDHDKAEAALIGQYHLQKISGGS